MADLRRSLAMRVLWAYHGTWYTWGGDDPYSIDCSGLVINVLKSVGLLPRKYDDTAHGIFKRLHLQEIHRRDVEPGCLVFWLRESDRKAVHVEMVVQVEGKQVFCMGASGGGSKVRSVEDAIKYNAYVKVRPMDSRKGPKAYVDPFKEGFDARPTV